MVENGDTMLDKSMGMAGGFFAGEFTHTLDPKQRLTIPAAWRSIAGESKQFFVVPDMDEAPFLSLYTVQNFKKRLASLTERSIADREARRMARLLGSRADFVTWDSAGRVRVKDELLRHAGLSSQVIMLGALDRIELWAPERWETARGGEDVLSVIESNIRSVGI